jgi:hypothetical protein
LVKIVFPMLVAAFVTGTSAASAEPPDCNGFPDFRARMNCYEVVSRAPPETATPAKPDGEKPRPPITPKRKAVRVN